ncbi:MAG: polysaccharide biosynthesis C-terminal domain-containing protein [Ferruginibacter sp.]|nr:polysaccharide biosynthesis C-terminal domain-containing protein [Ferruginibacter sp.]
MQLRQLIYTNILWRGINMFSVFVLNLLLSNVYGAANYGSLFYYVNALAFIVLLVGFSLDASFTFYNAKPNTNTNQFTKLAIVWSVSGAVIATLIVFFYNKIVNANFSIVNCFMYVTGMLLLTFFTSLFNAKHHYITQNLTIAVVNTGLAISLIFLKDNFNAFTQLFFITVLLQGLAIAVGYIFRYVQKTPLQLVDKITVKILLQYASIAFVGNVLFFLMYRVDYWFIDYFVKDKLMLGNYIQVSKVGQLFFIIPSIVASTVFAVTAEGKKENMQHKVVQLSKLLFIGTLLLCIPLVFWGNRFFPFAFGESFIYMYQPFLLLLPGIVILSGLFPVTSFYSGKKRIVKNIYGLVISLVVLIVSDLLLIPTYSINGAALGCTLAYFVYGIYIIFDFYKGIKKSL